MEDEIYDEDVEYTFETSTTRPVGFDDSLMEIPNPSDQWKAWYKQKRRRKRAEQEE